MLFFNDTATTEIYTLSLHDALPIWASIAGPPHVPSASAWRDRASAPGSVVRTVASSFSARSEEYTSELQSRQYLVCRLLLQKKYTITQLCTSNPLPRVTLISHIPPS